MNVQPDRGLDGADNAAPGPEAEIPARVYHGNEEVQPRSLAEERGRVKRWDMGFEDLDPLASPGIAQVNTIPGARNNPDAPGPAPRPSPGRLLENGPELSPEVGKKPDFLPQAAQGSGLI